MPNEAIELSDVIPASPQRIYDAWLDAAQHGAMTGAQYSAEGQGVGARYRAVNGAFWGEILALEPGQRVVESVRSASFSPDAPDSRAEILLQPVEGGTRITIRQTEVPPGLSEPCRKGWSEFYLTGMKRYFSAPVAAAAPAESAPAASEPAPAPAQAAAPAPVPVSAPAPAKKAAPRKRPAAKKKAAKRVKRPAKKAPAKKAARKAATVRRKARPAAAKKRSAKRVKRRA